MKNTSKILFISHSPYLNGAEICLFNLVKNINRNLIEPVVIFPETGPLTEKVKRLDIKTYLVPLERWIRYDFEEPLKNSNIKSRVKKIIDIIEKEKIDLVHTNTSVIVEGAIAAKLRNIPHVWHVHEYLKENSELTACIPVPLIFWLISSLSEKIVSVSNFVKGQFGATVKKEKILTIYDGVEGSIAPVEVNYLLNKFGIDKREIIALIIARLTEAKGYIELLSAASNVKKKGYKVKFLWIGEASKKALRDFNIRRRKLKVQDSAFYLGFSDETDKILGSVDLLLCTSKIETVSLAILEAMAAGLPVISTDCGGPSECVADNETGFIVPVDDTVKLSERIIELCENSQKRKIFGENGLKRYNENFRAMVYAERFEKLYMDILGNKDVKPVSPQEKLLLDSFLEVYEVLSQNHWKQLKKKS